MKGINDWLKRIKTDEKFAKQNNGKTIDEIIRIAKSQNYKISEEDIISNVSGGLKTSVVVDTTAITTGHYSSSEERSNIIVNL